MKTCPYCGEDNRDSNTICVSCGGNLDVEANREYARKQALEAKKICPCCGEENRSVNTLCIACGNRLDEAQRSTASSEQSNTQPAAISWRSNQSDPYRAGYYSNGGLIFWSIITILLCTPCGVVGLVMSTCINNCTAASVQNSRISAAKTWNTIGTVLGLIGLILYLLGHD